MSSYNQISETRTLAETLGIATAEIMALHDEMSDLCATIAAQFPDTYDSIGKYQQAYHAVGALSNACTTLEEPLDRVDPPLRRQAVTVRVGKQMRSNRSSSQRVRLGNAIVRLKGVADALGDWDWIGLREDLMADITELESVEFPVNYG